MNRRDLITLLGGAAAWPLVARAQQANRVRRIAVLRGESENDQQTKAGLVAFRDELAKLGWAEGADLHIEFRFGNDDPQRIRANAIELAALAPEVVVTGTRAATAEMARQTQSIPIVFTGVGDPLVYGMIKDLARPEGNITGFNNYYPSLGGKWIELLKEAAPQIARVAVIINPRTAPNSAYLPSIEAAARSLTLEVVNIPVRNAIETVRSIDAFAAQPNGSLLLRPGNADRETILELAIEHRLPLISANQFDAAAGALMTYTSDAVDRYRHVASYVDRILRGAKISDLPVQYPAKFELVINLKTAKTIGLTIPESFLLRADEVIE